MKFIKNIAVYVRESLNSPAKILVFCMGFFVLTMSLNGVPLRLWGLYRDMDRYQAEMGKADLAIQALSLKLSQPSDTLYIEKQARDRLDLAGEDDLIFVFPNQ
jgi:cell division protein FtsB